ncbi:MAG: hypothetical protein MZV70_58685 [Desulfobacterales bacterium]|nr:hypothetical protein [Desulfobacterales bacterium]
MEGAKAKPSEQGTYRDAEAGWTYLVQQRGVAPERMILFGRSLGSAVAAEIALRHRAGALIVESGFTSVADLGQRYFPYLPVRLLTRHRYETVEKVGQDHDPQALYSQPRRRDRPFSAGYGACMKRQSRKNFSGSSAATTRGFSSPGASTPRGSTGSYHDTSMCSSQPQQVPERPDISDAARPGSPMQQSFIVDLSVRSRDGSRC